MLGERAPSRLGGAGKWKRDGRLHFCRLRVPPDVLEGPATNNRGSDGGKGEAGVDRPKGDDRIFDCLHKPPASALLDSLAGPNFVGSPPSGETSRQVTSDPLAIANVKCDHPCTYTASDIFETLSPSIARKHGVVDLLRPPNCRESCQIAVTYVPLRTNRCPFPLTRLRAAAAILAKRRLAWSRFLSQRARLTFNVPRYSNNPSRRPSWQSRALAELICRPRFIICRWMAILKF